MPNAPKPFIITLVAAVTFAVGAAPAEATPLPEDFSVLSPSLSEGELSQHLATATPVVEADVTDPLASLGTVEGIPHGFDVDATIAQAVSEVGTSRPTGWSQPGECIMSVQRWVHAGGGDWRGGGNPVTNYDTATRLTLADAQPGDVIQYEHLTYPTSWVSGVHTVLITGVNDDGTFAIVESNNPMGSGLVTMNERWTPQPPAGFQAVVWRF